MTYSDLSSVLCHLSPPSGRSSTNSIVFSESARSCSPASPIVISSSNSDCESPIDSTADVVDRATAFVTNAELEERTDRNRIDHVSEKVACITRLPVDGDSDYVVTSNGPIDVSIETAISSLTARWKDWWQTCIRAQVKDTLLQEF